MPNADAPLMTEAELVRAAREGALPARWRVTLADGSLRPLFARGVELTVVRGAPEVGALACVVAGGRVRFRRVLARRDDAWLLRGEATPFADGWSTSVVGAVATSARFDRLARHTPQLWTWLGWCGAWLTARSRAALTHRAPRVRRATALTVRPLTPADAPALARFLDRVYGAQRSGEASAGTRERDLHLGLFTPLGELVGRTWLAVRGDEGYSHTTIVDPAWRGLGGGLALVRAAVAAARERGLARVRAHIAARNFASRAAYARAGFAPTGRWWTDANDPFAAAEMQLVEVAVALG